MYGGSGFAPLGLIIAFVVMLGLAVFMKWAFSGPGSPEWRRRGRATRPLEDDGLLTRIATLSHRESALALRAVLSDAGIRSTLRFDQEGPDQEGPDQEGPDQEGPDQDGPGRQGPGDHGRTTVLVFPQDADRARALALSFPGQEPQG
jgi:hypothetical protein